MNKHVILITGTPCTGKTTMAKQLAAKLDAQYINLTEFAKNHRLTLCEDKKRKTFIIDEEKMRQKITETINNSEKLTIIVDGHYAAAIVPKSFVTRIFVLRRNPIELRSFMEKCGFEDAKLWENLASEILDVCLVEALREQNIEKVCELDISGKTVETVVNEILSILNENKKCTTGYVDWLKMLERKGITNDYLKI